MVVSSRCAKVQHWWTSRVHMQQDAIDGVHFPSTGLVRLDECELPIAIQPNAPEQVRDGHQRVGGPLIIFRHRCACEFKEGPGEGDQMSRAERPPRKTCQDRSEKSRKAVRRSRFFHHFPLHCPTALKRTSCSRPCCTVLGGACVGSLSSSPSRGGRRGHLSWRGRAAASSLYPLRYPIGEENVPGMVDIHLHIVSLLPHEPQWCIYAILPPLMLCVGLPLFPPPATAFSSAVPCTSCTNYHCIFQALSSSP